MTIEKNKIEYEVIEGELYSYVMEKSKFSFLKKLPSNHFTESKLAECIENGLILTGELDSIEYHDFHFFSLYSQSPSAYDLFWKKQVHLCHHPKIEKITSFFIEDILLSRDFDNKEEAETFFDFLQATEKNTGSLNWNIIRDAIALSNQNLLFEIIIKKQKLTYTLDEDLNLFLRNLNAKCLEQFLEHSQNFYIEYGKAHNSLGYGIFFHHNETDSLKKVEIIKDFFEDHPEFNHQKWIQNIFQTSFFEEQIPFYKTFSKQTKTFFTKILEENPEYFNLKITTNKEENHYSKPIVDLKDLLSEYFIAKPLVDIYHKYENEKILKNKLTPNNPPKPPSKRF